MDVQEDDAQSKDGDVLLLEAKQTNICFPSSRLNFPGESQATAKPLPVTDLSVTCCCSIGIVLALPRRWGVNRRLVAAR
eukprot:m.33182 g.33182  ORF g.33182 m.33182 type:complete len:79 (-) comp9597_c0_seq1:1092-1328(-)